MAKLKIKNVGPIKDGYDSSDGFIDFKGVTVFIGNQGSGKSTIAKLFSTLSWIEKALIRGDFTEAYVMKYNRFKNKHLAYQNLSNYLNDNSYIEYIGNAYRLIYENNQFSAFPSLSNTAYSFPKIMYVPAERNFVSSVDRPDLVKRLPLPLYTFMDEFLDAKHNLSGGIDLPIGNTRFEFIKQRNKGILVGNGYNLDLLEASSGFQSLVPLILVTRHLSEIVKAKGSVSRKDISRDEEEKIRKTINKLFENENISEDVLKVALENLSSRYRYESFINVVEEPEQNLYPTSQKDVLFELLKYRNLNSNNKLIITTHSPYLINYLTISVKADELKMNPNFDRQKENINSIVPLNSTLNSNELRIYELDEKYGCIKILKAYRGLPSDENQLNEKLGESNEFFAQLLEIQSSL